MIEVAKKFATAAKKVEQITMVISKVADFEQN